MSDAMEIKFAEVNGTKPKSLRYGHVKRACKQIRTEQGTHFLTQLSKSLYGCFKRRFCDR